MFAFETKADCDVQAVYPLQAIMTLWSCDVNGCWQENRDVHGNNWPGSETTQSVV